MTWWNFKPLLVAKISCILNLKHHCCVSICVPLLHFNEAKAGAQALINLKMKHYSGCAIDVSYMWWQIQAIPHVPSVIISFSPGRNLPQCLLTSNYVKCWGGREGERVDASQADCSHRRRIIFVNHPSAPWLAELMTHKHTWLHNGGANDWWNDSITPGECYFNKSFPHTVEEKTK